MSTKRPNFLIILADDLGFSDVGCFGSEIRTPNLDKLSKKGIRMTNFHTAAACSPTRSMLLTGTDNHIAGIGSMIEKMGSWLNEENIWANKPGHEGYLNHDVAALPELLQDAGYHTIHAGKWHLGRETDQIPHARGFDRSYVCLPGCHNHYAWEPQFQDGDEDAEQLAGWVKGCYTNHNMYTRDAEYIDIVPNFPKQKDGFFSTVTFTDELLGYLKERQETPALKEKPFFAYYCFTAPHWPLQADKERREVYKGLYDSGPAELRMKRLEALKILGMIPEDVKPHDVVNPFNKTTWEDMTAEEKKYSARAMETYAAMVEQIDENVGKVIDQIERDGELDNTFIIFMSDNGAEGASYEMYPIFGPGVKRIAERFYNNDLDNIGEPDSFVWYGDFWAQAATAPSWLYKMFTSQGGIRVPFILHYPPMKHKNGAILHPFATVMDIMPTVLDLAGVEHPVPRDAERGEYRGKNVFPMRGTSWTSWLQGKGDLVSDQSPMGWELHGRAAMRLGDWKIVYMPPPHSNGEWQLFDLKNDPGETTDLRSREPVKFEQLLRAWDHYVATTQVVWGQPTGAGTTVDMGPDETEDPTGWMKKAIQTAKSVATE